MLPLFRCNWLNYDTWSIRTVNEDLTHDGEMIHEYYMNRHKGISLVVIPSDEMAFLNGDL